MAIVNLNTVDFIEGDGVSVDENVVSIESSGGVETVTGDGVDNTDPANPVISYPTPGDIGALATGTAWLLASGGTLTGVNTITSNAANQLIYTGTFTATANNQYHTAFLGSLTARATASDTLYGYNFAPTLVASAATQTLCAVEINPTFTPGAFAPTMNKLCVGNTDLRVNSLGQLILGSPATITANTSIVIRPQSTNAWIQRNNGDTSTVATMTAAGALTLSQLTTTGANGIDVQAGTALIRSSTGVLTIRGRGTSSLRSINFSSENAIPGGGTYSAFAWSGTVFTSNTGTTQDWTITDYNLTVGATNSSAVTTLTGIKYDPVMSSFAVASVLHHYAWRHLKGFIAWQSILTPSQITSDQDDYDPDGLSDAHTPYGASILRVNTDASREITGIAGGLDGRLLIIANVGSNDCVIKDEDTGSTAANRFALNGDLTLNADESLMFWYDGTSSRWRALTL